MRIFDNHKKIDWSTSKAIIQNREIVLAPESYASTVVFKGGLGKLKVIGQKISGDGEFEISMSQDNKIFFYKKLSFTKKGSSEISIDIGRVPDNFVIEASKSSGSIGRVIIERLIIEGDFEIAEDYSDSEGFFDDNFYKYELSSKDSSKTTIAVVVPYGIYGGAEVYLKSILNKTPKSFDIDLLYLKENTLEVEINNPNVNHKKVFNIRGLCKQIMSYHYDCVVYYNSANVYRALSDIKISKELSTKLIEIYHSDFEWSDAVSKLKKRSGVSAIFRVDEELAKDIEGVEDYNKVTVPVGIDLDIFFRKKDKDLSLKDLGLSNKFHTFGTVARLSPEKNIDYAIDLVSSIKNANLIIVGDGPDKRRLESRISNNPRIKIIGYKKNIDEYYNIFDSFLLTSRYEGMPISILEAMATGLPIYSTAAGRIEDHIGSLDGVNILSGSIDSDRPILLDNMKKSLYFQNLRDFINKNHNIEKISSKFFLSIIDGSLSYIYNEGFETFYGEYI